MLVVAGGGGSPSPRPSATEASATETSADAEKNEYREMVRILLTFCSRSAHLCSLFCSFWLTFGSTFAQVEAMDVDDAREVCIDEGLEPPVGADIVQLRQLLLVHFRVVSAPE